MVLVYGRNDGANSVQNEGTNNANTMEAASDAETAAVESTEEDSLPQETTREGVLVAKKVLQQK
jgi:hypothetical protein